MFAVMRSPSVFGRRHSLILLQPSRVVDNSGLCRHDESMRRMSLRLFGQIVARVMETLPKEFQPYLDNIVVDVEEEPSIDLLRHQGFTVEEIANGDSLYGLFAPIALPTNWSGDVLDVRD